MLKKIIFIIILVHNLYSTEVYYFNSKQKIHIKPINVISRDISQTDYYQDNKGMIVGITNKLIVKLKEGTSIIEILKKFNLVLEKKIGKRIYLLKCHDKSLTLQISNNLNSEKDIEYSQPDFIKRRVRR